MSLKKYIAKRNFTKTPEPAGGKKGLKSSLIFVVQKHHASHLHYDFRLELNGVLLSWAIPKGPSLNPADKRLAMQVEDHPYSYKDFEGNIPEGNYGGGNVIVWDNGTYHALNAENKAESEQAITEGLKKGHLTFILNGKKLHGEFSLVKMKNAKQPNAWLLVKKDDEFASTKDITENDKSVISKATLQDIAEKYGNEKSGDQPASRKKKLKSVTAPRQQRVAKGSLIKPMLAKLSDEPFNDPGWSFEVKYDGYRAMALCNGKGSVHLYSRNLLSFNDTFSTIAESLKSLQHRCLLDGEVVVEDKHGRSQFQLLQNYQNTKTGHLKYYVFDILSLDGNDTTQLPLTERKELLKLLLQKAKLKDVFYAAQHPSKGVSFFKAAQKRGLEGIIAKNNNSIYEPGRRGNDWLKIKITHEQEAIIVGFTAPAGSRKYFGSLLLAFYNNGQLQYAGNCGTGFDTNTLKALYEKFKPLVTATPPLYLTEKLPAKITWLKPKLVCQVKFTEWTQDGSMRHPVYLGLRADKKPKEVEREIIADMKTPKKKQVHAEDSTDDTRASLADRDKKVGSITLKLTNQNKIYWPAEGFTKGDMVNYYEEIAPVILPYIKNRPQSLHRFPNGIADEGFYQKDVDVDKMPGWLKTEKIYSTSNKKYIDYVICNDKATLLYMANLGCIEINPWNSRIDNPENPDWLVIDLDPEGISFKEVVKTALQTKKVLDEMEVDCYCKTSGATGLHIFVPLAAKYDYDIAKNFAQLVAGRVNELLPKTTSILRMPAKRKKKVYLDFLQNRRGQTLAAPYSIRPRPGATVSTPLLWTEVNEKLDPTAFTIQTIAKRLDKKGDLWKPVIGKGANLNAVIKKVYANV